MKTPWGFWGPPVGQKKEIFPKCIVRFPLFYGENYFFPCNCSFFNHPILIFPKYCMCVHSTYCPDNTCFLSFSFTVILFCMAALIFPIGFYINEVGGQPYKLPNNTVVGSSYVLFVLSIFFTIVGLLFAGKVCLPGWGDGPSLDSWGVQCETERNGTHREGQRQGMVLYGKH